VVGQGVGDGVVGKDVNFQAQIYVDVNFLAQIFVDVAFVALQAMRTIGADAFNVCFSLNCFDARAAIGTACAMRWRDRKIERRKKCCLNVA